MRTRSFYLAIVLFLFCPLTSAQWVQTSGPYGGFVYSLAVSGTDLFAGTSDGGVFLSTDGGTSWTAASTGLMNTYVFSLAVSGSSLFAGTYGGGVWRRPLSEMTSVRPSLGELPAQFGLMQNYPNPFNPSTTIRYGLPIRSDVTLTVFNTLGQQVALLQNGEQNAGYHEVRFNGSGLSSGVCPYRIQAGEFVQSRKLLLVR